MKIESEFQLPVAPDEAWRLLTDLERVAPCMPGVEVESVDGDELKGLMRVKVGPITSSYKTTVRVSERDQDGLRAVLDARGRESRGQGTANATVTATMAATDGGTRVALDTDLSVTGRVAQFGRGVLSEVADNLIRQFAARLEREGLAGEAAAPPQANGAGDVQPPPTATATRSEPEALDLGDAIASTRAAAVLQALAVAAALALLWTLLRRR